MATKKRSERKDANELNEADDIPVLPPSRRRCLPGGCRPMQRFRRPKPVQEEMVVATTSSLGGKKRRETPKTFGSEPFPFLRRLTSKPQNTGAGGSFLQLESAISGEQVPEDAIECLSSGHRLSLFYLPILESVCSAQMTWE